jgi:uncharacterized membrane protein
VSSYEFYLIVHILGAFMIAGGSLGATTLGIYAGNGTNVRTIRVAADLQHKIEYVLIIPGALIAIVFGSLLVTEISSVEFSDVWVSTSFLLWFVAMGLGTGMLGPHARRMREQADQLIAGGTTESAELQAEFASPRVKAVSTVLTLLLIVFVYLMVAKPGA